MSTCTAPRPPLAGHHHPRPPRFSPSSTWPRSVASNSRRTSASPAPVSCAAHQRPRVPLLAHPDPVGAAPRCREAPLPPPPPHRLPLSPAGHGRGGACAAVLLPVRRRENGRALAVLGLLSASRSTPVAGQPPCPWRGGGWRTPISSRKSLP